MKFNTKGLLRSAALPGLFISTLIVTGCSDSNDSSEVTPPVAPSSVQAGVYDSTVVEGADDLEFVVSLSVMSSEAVSVDYATADGTAVAGSDYSATSGTVQFAPGETRKFISVTVPANTALPTTTGKKMQLILSNPENVTLIHETATGTIIDSDAMSTDSVHSDNWMAKGTFSNAANCANGCHVTDGNSMDDNGKDISPGTQWKHSVMANAFNDPYWRAAVEDEVDSFPHLAGFIEDTCTRCHAPMGRTHAHHTGADLDADNYFRFDTAKTQDHSREGVSCTVCHQIDAGNLGTADSFSGGFSIVGDPLDADYKKIYGPYDVSVGVMRMSNITGGHTPVEGRYVSESALCATCHTLYTPSLDPDTGTSSGNSFLEQGVYFEWQNSVYATGQLQEAQCQGCHMPEPAPGYSTAITLDPGNVPDDRSPYRQHTLVGGGNAHLLEILRDYRTELGIASTTTTGGFDEQIALTQNFLGSAASINVPALVTNGDSLEFDVEVTNNAGHKVPTAYPSRRAWLHVVVKSAGNIIFESAMAISSLNQPW